MDHYDDVTSQNTEEREDVPFYYMQACAEDAIWPGSDTEETAEEIQQKRSRYEYQARRYLQGHLPVLQSATLRGPFSGWTNPWRWAPQVKEDDWWQPGSENMLFTRANVMKRAANHGFGYLSPAEALAWCKASAKADAQHVHGDTSAERYTQPAVVNPLVILNSEETSKQPPSKGNSSTLNSDLTNSYGKHSMVYHHSDAPRSAKLASNCTGGTKRPVDSQWLKGSYASKRARWDGPAISTPTPLLEMGELPRRRHQSFPKTSRSSNRRTNGPLHLSVSYAELQSGTSHMDISGMEPHPQLIASASGGSTSVISARNATYRKSSSERNGDILKQQREEIDELHDESQESYFATTFRNRCQRKSRRSSRGIADASSLVREPGDLIVITPRRPSPSSTSASRILRQNFISNTHSNQLPEILRNTPATYNGLDAVILDDGGEYSFTTEVAPSSRDLEMFQYRKKRRRKDSEALKPNPSVIDLAVNCQKPSRAMLKSEQNDEYEHQPDNLGLIAAETDNERDKSPDIIEAPASEDGTRERSNHSDTSWDFMNDIIQQSSSQLVEDGIPARTLPPKQCSFTDYSSAIPIPQVGDIPSKISNQHSKLSFRLSQSHQSQSLPDPRKNSPRPSVARRMGMTQDLGESTKSHKTSSLRPVGPSPSEDLPEDNVDNIQYGTTSSNAIQNVMDHLHKNFPQQFPGFTSAASTQSGNEEGSEIEDQKEMRSGSIHEPQLDRRHFSHSSGPNGSSQQSVKEEETNTESEVDAHPGPTVVNRPQRTQHAQHRPHQNLFHAENTELGPESEIIAEPRTIVAAIAQDSSHQIVNGQDARTSTDSSDSTMDLTRAEKSASSALGETCRATGAGSKMDEQSVGHEHGYTNTAGMDLETSWEGCGPQSPWAAENLKPMPMTRPETKIQGGLLTNFASAIDGLRKGDDFSNKTCQSKQQDWYPFEGPQTPQNDVITPFKDLMSPTPAREVMESHLEGGELPSTQKLVDAATKNPWSSNLRSLPSKKSKKRVSFGVLPPEEKENSQPDRSDDLDTQRRSPGSPPPPPQDTDKELIDESITTVNTFRRHFVATGHFKHILPRNLSSPRNSSPAFGAQAEAFIAADREASTERRRSTTSPKSPSRQLKSSKDRIQEGSWSRDTLLISSKSSSKVPGPDLGNLIASFDMDDALDDVGGFLEDWSVDAELKKAKESGSGSCHESNGYRRRKLFGIV